MHADVVERRATQHRLKLVRHNRLPQHADDLVFRQIAGFVVDCKSLIVDEGDGVDELAVPFFSPQLLILGDRLHVDHLPLLGRVEVESLHLDQVDDPAKARRIGDRSLADRDRNRNRVRPEPLGQLAEHSIKSRSDPVHFVDEADSRDVVLVRLTPHGLTLSLDPFDSAEHHDATIEDSQAAFDLGGEIDMSRRVDDVDRVSLPLARNGRRVNRDPPLGLLAVEVGDGRAVIDVPHAMGHARIKQDAFGGRRLPGINVSDDADVANLFNGGSHGWLRVDG